jgi:hypothetical protein
MKKATYLLAAIVLSLGLPSASIAEPACGASVDQASSSLGDLLVSVTGPPDRAVAVGEHFVGGDGSPFLAQRVDDGWRAVRVPTEPGARTIELQDAFADGPRVWVVGAFRNDRPQAGLYHEGRWFWTHPIDPGDGEDELLGVATARDGTVWAVGKHQAGTNYEPLIERYDGARWTVVPVPAVQGSAVLKDIAVAPDGVLYAVGWRVLRGGQTQPLVLRSAGAAWRIDPTPGEGLLSGVGIEPGGTPIAVGWVPTDDGDQVVSLERRSTWRATAPSTDSRGRLTAVASGEATIAVGGRSEDGVPVPTVMRFSQHGWVPLDVTGEAAPETGGDQLLGVTGEAGSFLAVGIRDATDAFSSLVVTGSCVG